MVKKRSIPLPYKSLTPVSGEFVSVFQYYYVEYDQDEDSTDVLVRFRLESATGESLQLDQSCSVTHNSHSMSEKNIMGWGYERLDDGLVAEHAFVFTDNDGKTYENMAPTIKSVSFTNPGTIDCNSPGEIHVTTTESFSDGDKVTLEIRSTPEVEGAGSYSETASPTSGTSVDIGLDSDRQTLAVTNCD